MEIDSALSLYELLDIAASQWSKIDSLWNFFLWIHLAILGGLIAVDRPVSILERLTAMAIYSAFLFLNYLGLSTAYGYFEAIILQIRAYPDVAHAEQVRAYLDRVPLDIFPLTLEAVYLLGFTFTGVALTFANSFVRAKLKARARSLGANGQGEKDD